MQATHPSYSRETGWPNQVSPLRRAQQLFQTGFVGMLIVVGLDKFFRLFTDWAKYLAPAIESRLPFAPNYLMYAAGLFEIALGIVVAFAPRFGGYLAAGWLLLIAANLVLAGGYLDVALRDAGLALSAIAFARLSAAMPRG
jgi:hypothetical protein